MAETSGSAPLNTQAKADIDASLGKAKAEDLSGAPKPLIEENVGGQESRRIYEDPSQDPAIKATQEEAARFTNADSEVMQARTIYDETWRKVNHREGGRLADDFVRKYPEKATAYRDKFPALQQALERQSVQEQVQAESPQPKRLENDPDFRNFMDDPQSGLNARIWADVSVDQGLTSAQYLQRAEILKPQMLAEFSAKHPDIYAKYNQKDIVGGLAVPNEQDNNIGGLADPTANPEQQFDLHNPASLLVMDSISIDDLFKLDYEESYNYMRRLVNHHDANIAGKAQRIMSVLDSAKEGKENFIKNNQGVTTINLTP